MPPGATIAFTTVSLIWLCGCGLLMQLTTHGVSPVERPSFGTSLTAEYGAQDAGRFAALRVGRIG